MGRKSSSYVYNPYGSNPNTVRDDPETGVYGIWVSLLSRDRIPVLSKTEETEEEVITTGLSVEDIVIDLFALWFPDSYGVDPAFYPKIPEGDIYPEKGVIKIASAIDGPFVYTPDVDRVGIASGTSIRKELKKYAPRGEASNHFNLVHRTLTGIAHEFGTKGYEPPVVLPTNRWNTGKLFPLGGKVSVEPDGIIFIRDRKARYGYRNCKTAVVEAQATHPEVILQKMVKYRDLFNMIGTMYYVIIAVPQGIEWNVDDFHNKMNLLGFNRGDYAIREV